VRFFFVAREIRLSFVFSRVNLARRHYALQHPRDVFSRPKEKQKKNIATPRYGRNAAVNRDLCVYSGKNFGTDDGRSRDVISWQGPKSRGESMVSSVSTRVVPRCRCNNPRRSYGTRTRPRSCPTCILGIVYVLTFTKRAFFNPEFCV